MKIVCITTGKTKNLTLGGNYDVLDQTDEKYKILNDGGNEAEYYKKLFDVVPEVEPAPREVLGTVYQGKDDNNLHTFQVTIDGVNHAQITILEIDSVAGSCGVTSYSGITELLETLNSTAEDIERDVEEAEVIEVFISAVKELIAGADSVSVFSSTVENEDVESYGAAIIALRALDTAIFYVETLNNESGNRIFILGHNNPEENE